MNAAIISLAFDLAAVGIEKLVIGSRVDELAAAGKSDAEIADELRKWRDQAIAAAQAEIDRAP